MVMDLPDDGRPCLWVLERLTVQAWALLRARLGAALGPGTSPGAQVLARLRLAAARREARIKAVFPDAPAARARAGLLGRFIRAQGTWRDAIAAVLDDNELVYRRPDAAGRRRVLLDLILDAAAEDMALAGEIDAMCRR